MRMKMLIVEQEDEKKKNYCYMYLSAVQTIL